MADPIFRAPMHSRSLDLPRGAGAELCLRRGVVGIEADAGSRRLARFAEVPRGAFVWTRATDGAYHVGRIAGPCRREGGLAEVGLTHARPVDWLGRPFGEHEVPAGVAATFARGGRNFQQTHDAGAERRTAELWREHG